ncbi:hypothetical protein K0M31_019022 [Melipona bicolor]|uniref:Uncharacterized protein n=1 Tax=Melipona bicolor TaxID=60889 RepID=A0AA40KDL7_9HYME|nr:hypothetical protein K0M31_019022 [Melipona bicolor]
MATSLICERKDREKRKRKEEEEERGSTERSSIILQRFGGREDTRSTSCFTAERVSRVLPNGGRKRYPEAGNGRALLYRRSPGRAERSQPPGYGLVLSLPTGLVPRCSMQRVTQPREQRQLS